MGDSSAWAYNSDALSQLASLSDSLGLPTARFVRQDSATQPAGNGYYRGETANVGIPPARYEFLGATEKDAKETLRRLARGDSG